MKMKSLTHLFDLFYPRICMCCNTHLLDQEKVICLICRFDLPLVDNGDLRNNPTTKIFKGRLQIENGASFLFYNEHSKTKQLIHQLKYQGQQMIGEYIGNWFGKQLSSSHLFNEIDLIIPVPLHKSKLRKRGYNQLTKFGLTLSKISKKPFIEDILQRVSFTKTQTRKKRIERFLNTDSRFTVENIEGIQNCHILLIDDVVTTGATLEACCKELLKGKNVKISILTVGITE